MFRSTKEEGNEMSQLFLKPNGNVLPRRTLRPINIADIHSPVKINKMYTFDAIIERRWGLSMDPPKTNEPEIKDQWEEYEYKNEYQITIH